MLDELWRMRPRVVRVVRRYGVMQADAEDVAQEAMIGAWMSIVSGRWTPPERTPARLWSWVRAIAFRQSRNERRRSHHRKEDLRCPDELDNEEAPTTPEDRSRVLAELLADVPASRREVIVAKELQQKEVEAIAIEQGIPTSTAWSRLRMAREDLARAAQRYRARSR